jgi:hypothetical protein
MKNGIAIKLIFKNLKLWSKRKEELALLIQLNRMLYYKWKMY